MPREEARVHVANDVLRGYVGRLGAREQVVHVRTLALAVEGGQVLLGLHARDLADQAHAGGKEPDEVLIRFFASSSRMAASSGAGGSLDDIAPYCTRPPREFRLGASCDILGG